MMTVRTLFVRTSQRLVRKLPVGLVALAFALGCIVGSGGEAALGQVADNDAPAAGVEPMEMVLVEPPASEAGAASNTSPEDALLDRKIPIAEVDVPRHDFGKVWQVSALQHAFVIRNAGDAPLRIVRVKPGCGCTVAGDYPKSIAPGESGTFPFKLNTKRITGKFTKSITVSTNDSKHNQVYLSLAGEARPYVDMKPRNVQFGRVKTDSVLTSKITLTNNTDDPLELSLAENQDLKCFSARIDEIKPGQQFSLTVTAHPPFATGINRVTIPVKTNIPAQKTLEVTCIATLPKRIELRPDKLKIPSLVRAQTVRKFSLTNNGDQPLHITSAAATDNRLTVETQEIEAGRKYQLNVTIPANYANPPANAAIVIKTDGEKDAELRLPIIGRQARSKKAPKRPAMTMLGKPAPATQAATFKGDVIDIGGKHDKVQMLAFYASWCGFCKRALPKIEALQQKYADNADVEVVAINLDERVGRRARTEAETIAHYEKMGLSLPMVLDAKKDIAKPYKVTSFPTMFVIGRQGDIEAVHVGARAGFDRIIASQIDLLIEGKTRADFPRAISSVPIVPSARAAPAVGKPVTTTAGSME